MNVDEIIEAWKESAMRLKDYFAEFDDSVGAELFDSFLKSSDDYLKYMEQKYPDDSQRKVKKKIKMHLEQLTDVIKRELESTRSRALIITKLEEARLWIWYYEHVEKPLEKEKLI